MTAAEFKVLFPVFVDIDNAVVTTRISWAAAQMSASVFGNLYDQALAYLTAHLMTIDLLAAFYANAGQGGKKGIVTTETVGELSRSYGSYLVFQNAVGSGKEYDSTPYGKQYQKLLYMVTAGPLVITGPMVF